MVTRRQDRDSLDCTQTSRHPKRKAGGLPVGVPEAWSPGIRLPCNWSVPCTGLAKGRPPGIGLAKGRPPGGGVPKNWPCTQDRVGVGSATKRGRPHRGRYP